MRTTLELPDPLFRRLKAKAALEGTTLKALINALVERGLSVNVDPQQGIYRDAPPLPTIQLGHRLNLPEPSNAALFELLDD